MSKVIATKPQLIECH